jgi:riboflavin biosynthesis RibT protein
MLLKYRSEYKKIAIDMLSLLPNMGKGEHLREEMSWYNDQDSRIMYLWKNKDGKWAGLIAIEIKHNFIIVRRLVLTPDSWSMNNCCHILDELSHLYLDTKIVGTMETTSICEIWEKQNGIRS